MSWAEVKKINSDLGTPLNITLALNQMDLIGNAYVGTNNTELMKLLMSDNETYSHSVATSVVGEYFWDYVMNMSSGAGQLISDVFGLSMAQYNTLSDLIASPTDSVLFINTEKIRTTIVYNTTALSLLMNTGSIEMLNTLANDTVWLSEMWETRDFKKLCWESSRFSSALLNSANLSRGWMITNHSIVYQAPIGTTWNGPGIIRTYVVSLWGNWAGGTSYIQTPGYASTLTTDSKALSYVISNAQIKHQYSDKTASFRYISMR